MSEQILSRPRARRVPAATSLEQQFVMALGRALLSVLFLFAGIGKIGAPAMTIGYIQSAGLPLPEVPYGIAIAVEIGCGTMLLLGFLARPAAVILAIFSVATAIGFHHDFADQNQLIHFLKDVSIAGGLLYVAALGAGRVSIDGRRH